MSAASAITTHGIVSQPGNRVRASSEGLGWRSIVASTQREVPFEGAFAAVDDHLLVFHLNGPARVNANIGAYKVERVVPPGHLFLWPGGESFRVALQDALDTLHIYLRHDLVAEVANELGICVDRGEIELRPRLGEQDQFLEQLALEIRGSLSNADPSTAIYVEQIARVMAYRLLREHSNHVVLRPFLEFPQGLNRIQIDRIDDFIDGNISNRFSLSDLASAGGLSVGWFVRRFRVTTGLPPHQYVLRRRVARAQRLLSGDELVNRRDRFRLWFCPSGAFNARLSQIFRDDAWSVSQR